MKFKSCCTLVDKTVFIYSRLDHWRNSGQLITCISHIKAVANQSNGVSSLVPPGGGSGDWAKDG
jgi:hypothetical protein